MNRTKQSAPPHTVWDDDFEFKPKHVYDFSNLLEKQAKVQLPAKSVQVI